MNLTDEQVKLLELNKIIPQNCPRPQIDFFSTVCEKKKLDPFLKHIHLVERNERDGQGGWRKSYTIQAGIDGMRVIAQRNCKIKSYKRWVEKRDDDLYGICEIKTKDRGKYYDELPFKEYVQTKRDGTPNSFWKKFSQTMIKKCAEESVLRMMAPEDLSGVYGDDEMLQADSETVDQKKITEGKKGAQTNGEKKQLGFAKKKTLSKIDIEKKLKDECKTVPQQRNLWVRLTKAQQQNPEILGWFEMRKVQIVNELKELEKQVDRDSKTNNEKAAEMLSPEETNGMKFINAIRKLQNAEDLKAFYDMYKEAIMNLPAEEYEKVSAELNQLEAKFNQ